MRWRSYARRGSGGGGRPCGGALARSGVNLRILLVSEDIPHPLLGGLGKHVLALARELHHRGHEVDLLGNADHSVADLPTQAGPGRFIAGIRGHQRLFKEKQLGVFLPWRADWNARAVREAILRHSGGYDVVHYHGHLPWLAANLPLSLPFTQTRHDQGGDCILNTRYANPPPADFSPCRALDASACAGCATAHPGAVRRAVSAAAVRGLRKRTAAAYDAHPVVFVSEFLRQGFARVAGGIERGEVVHNGVSVTALAEAVAAPALPRGAEIEVFTAGAVTPYKGFVAVVEALRKSPLRPGTRLTIAGDGPDMPRLRALAAGLPVRLLGWISHAEVLRQTRSADFVLVPSLWEEPFGGTTLEALALGRTVLALRRGGTPELAKYAGPGANRLKLFDSLPELLAGLYRSHELPVSELPEQSLQLFRGSIATMTDALELHYGHVRARAGAEWAGPSRA